MDIMIDIETLDIKPTAVITQVGAVRFDRDSGKILDTFDMWCDVRTQIDSGRTIDESTVKFWEEHDRPLYWWKQNKGQPLANALSNLSRFMLEQDFEYVWANSPSFDLIILSNAMGITPWNFRKERDVRTLMSLVNFTCKINRGIHDALSDSIDQALSVINAYRFLKKGERDHENFRCHENA